MSLGPDTICGACGEQLRWPTWASRLWTVFTCHRCGAMVADSTGLIRVGPAPSMRPNRPSKRWMRRVALREPTVRCQRHRPGSSRACMSQDWDHGRDTFSGPRRVAWCRRCLMPTSMPASAVAPAVGMRPGPP